MNKIISLKKKEKKVNTVLHDFILISSAMFNNSLGSEQVVHYLKVHDTIHWYLYASFV